MSRERDRGLAPSFLRSHLCAVSPLPASGFEGLVRIQVGLNVVDPPVAESAEASPVVLVRDAAGLGLPRIRNMIAACFGGASTTRCWRRNGDSWGPAVGIVMGTGLGKGRTLK